MKQTFIEALEKIFYDDGEDYSEPYHVKAIEAILSGIEARLPGEKEYDLENHSNIFDERARGFNEALKEIKEKQDELGKENT